jgi:hypothetical protein
MRFVIYDDETLEPITVLNLPFTDRDIDQKMRERGRRWRVPVPPELPVTWQPVEVSPQYEEARIVDLEFEPFVRNSRRNGEQRSWMCFTRAAELAMLLKPDWLPGQRSAVNYLQDQNDRLTRMLMRVFD